MVTGGLAGAADAGAEGSAGPGTPADADGFFALSQILTGVSSLGTAVARRHAQTLRTQLGDAPFAAELQKFRKLPSGSQDPAAALEALLARDAAFAGFARLVLTLWYTGLVQTPDAGPRFVHPEDYFDALVWPAIGAHAPASSDGYYGHWRLPPDSGSGA